MKVIQIEHMGEKCEGVWINRGGTCICETTEATAISILEGELEGLLDGSCSGILITCVDMTEEEMEGLGEFTGW